MVRDTVRQIERRVRSKSRHYDQDERSERASTEKADHSEQANQTPSQLACAWCARCVFFCAQRGPLKKSCGATRARSLCFIVRYNLRCPLFVFGKKKKAFSPLPTPIQKKIDFLKQQPESNFDVCMLSGRPGQMEIFGHGTPPNQSYFLKFEPGSLQ